MSGDLYDILHITREATSEEIRKAYKKRALQTHPDRLPANYTPAEKAAAEDKFRKVNNAYEILKDPQKRQSYDQHGVWPPPTAEAVPPASQYDYSTRYRPWRNEYPRPNHPDPFTLFTDFHFTDPFELFDSFFQDSLHPRDRHHSRDNRSPRRRTTYDVNDNHDDFGFSRARDPHSRADDMMANFQDMHRNMLSTSAAFPRTGMSMGFPPMISHFPTFPSFPSLVMDASSSSGSGSGRWASESTMSQTINGVTQTVQKRRDWDGNVHVSRTYPDGRKVVTINGVEQRDQGHGFLPPPHSTTNHNTRTNYLPSPPPPYSTAPNPGEAMNYGNTVAPRPSERHIIPVVPSYRDGHRGEQTVVGTYRVASDLDPNKAYENENRTIPSPTHTNSYHPKKRWWNRHGG